MLSTYLYPSEKGCSRNIPYSFKEKSKSKYLDPDQHNLTDLNWLSLIFDLLLKLEIAPLRA